MEVNKKIGSGDCVTEFRATGVDRVWFEFDRTGLKNAGCVIVCIGPERFRFFAGVDGSVLVKDGE